MKLQQNAVLASADLPDIVLTGYLTFLARISISEYIFLSVYEMASKFSARCARRPFLKKNIVNQWKKELADTFFYGI